MSEIHKFLFEGLPVRGSLVRLTDGWAEILRRRAASPGGAYALPVQQLLGEMVAAGVLMQSQLKFDGSLAVQIMGEGPLKLAVAEVKSDLGFRATASVRGAVFDSAALSALVSVAHQGKCAITLTPTKLQPGQSTYQGVVPLTDAHGQPLESLSAMLGHYMLQSEQLEATLMLAANDQVAAGMLIQRMPVEGLGNLAQHDPAETAEHYDRISILATSLRREELLSLDAQTILRRLFWEENLALFAPMAAAPHFSCSCSRTRVANMLVGLGEAEALGMVQERGVVEVGCEFCGTHYQFDPVDVAGLFRNGRELPPHASVH